MGFLRRASDGYSTTRLKANRSNSTDEAQTLIRPNRSIRLDNGNLCFDALRTEPPTYKPGNSCVPGLC
ncbi:Uncharacterized protein HZ326_6312 [Fusarium oxysporum f. sp. albedinis]|nr:Uncharacterized protein HZ326_6312 [Fusarium oxysporum f. sp. albedinis]